MRLARHAHPDFHAEADAATRAAHEAEIRRLNEAWAVLGDAEAPPALRPSLAGWAGARAGAQPLGRARARTRCSCPTTTTTPTTPPCSTTRPSGNGARLPRAVQLAPAVLLVAAVFALSAGVVTSFGPLLGFGLVCLVLSGLSFVLTPALAVMRSLDSERD